MDPGAGYPNLQIKPSLNNSDLDPGELDMPDISKKSTHELADQVPVPAKSKEARANTLAKKMKNSKEQFMKRKPKKEQLYYLYKLALNRRYLSHSLW